MSNPIITFDNVVKVFPGCATPAVDHVTLNVEEGSIVTILGTSGSGKTTLLKLVNRLYDLTSGTIKYRGDDIRDLPEAGLRRKLGYVIQQSGLFPHKTVKENIATVPKILKWDKQKIDARIDELMELVRIEPEYKNRFPRKLSGGQQQRVSVARALAAEPDVLLMDEPFGAIDVITREILQNELLILHKRLGTTILFVTHSVQEAFKLGRQVMIMDAGKVQQEGTPFEILSSPANEFVRQLVSTDSFYDRLRVLRVMDFAEEAGDQERLHVHTIDGDALLSEALQSFITSGSEYLTVPDESGKPCAKLTFDTIKRLTLLEGD